MDRVDITGFSSLFKNLARDRREHVGLMFGKSNRVLVYSPLKNEAREDHLFTGDPWDTVIAFTSTKRYGLELIGVFHTHPCGLPRPSHYDLEGMRRWPYIWVIASPYGIKAWRYTDKGIVEIGVVA